MNVQIMLIFKGYNDENGEYLHTCTGTIITELIIITAAHCTDPIDEWVDEENDDSFCSSK